MSKHDPPSKPNRASALYTPPDDGFSKQVSVHDLANEIRHYIEENAPDAIDWPDFIKGVIQIDRDQVAEMAKISPELGAYRNDELAKEVRQIVADGSSRKLTPEEIAMKQTLLHDIAADLKPHSPNLAKLVENAISKNAALKKPASPPERAHKLSLTSIYDEVKPVVGTSEADMSSALNNNSRKEEPTMTDKTTSVTVTATTHDGSAPAITIEPSAKAPHTISAPAMGVSDLTRKHIIIDPDTGAAAYGNLKFDDLAEFLPATQDEIVRSLASMNIVAVGQTHALGMEAAAFTKMHPKLEGVSGKFPGPIKGSHLTVSYKPATTMPSGDSTKVYHGTMTTSWKGIGGPGGNDYDAVKAAIRAATEAEQAS